MKIAPVTVVTTVLRASALAALVAGAFLAPALSAAASNLVVVEARGVSLAVGDTVDDAKPLVLKEGQHVSLITQSGTTLTLDGPYDKPPIATDTAGGGVSTVQALLTQQGARTSEIGVIRGGAVKVKLPDPWLLNTSRTGDVCLRDGTPVVLWRPSDQRSSTLVVMPSDRSWKAQATWPTGTTRLLMPPSVPMHKDATYLVSLDGNEVALTVSPVPSALDNNAMVAAWMAGKGCEA